MKKETKDKHFLKQPVYEGGPKALREFIAQHLQYPKAALDNKIEGTVHLRYDIDFKGNVVDVKVIGGIGHGCDEEAVRLVKMLKFSVEKTRGLRVLYHKNIQINFHLPKQQAAPATTVVQYQITTVPKPVEEEPQPQKSGSYSFTITIGR